MTQHLMINDKQNDKQNDKITLLDDIIISMYKIYYSHEVLTLIKNREESTLYLRDYNCVQLCALNYNVFRIMSGMFGLQYSS